MRLGRATFFIGKQSVSSFSLQSGPDGPTKRSVSFPPAPRPRLVPWPWTPEAGAGGGAAGQGWGRPRGESGGHGGLGPPIPNRSGLYPWGSPAPHALGAASPPHIHIAHGREHAPGNLRKRGGCWPGLLPGSAGSALAIQAGVEGAPRFWSRAPRLKVRVLSGGSWRWCHMGGCGSLLAFPQTPRLQDAGPRCPSGDPALVPPAYVTPQPPLGWGHSRCLSELLGPPPPALGRPRVPVSPAWRWLREGRGQKRRISFSLLLFLPPPLCFLQFWRRRGANPPARRRLRRALSSSRLF